MLSNSCIDDECKINSGLVKMQVFSYIVSFSETSIPVGTFKIYFFY